MESFSLPPGTGSDWEKSRTPTPCLLGLTETFLSLNGEGGCKDGAQFTSCVWGRGWGLDHSSQTTFDPLKIGLKDIWWIRWKFEHQMYSW